MPKDAQYTSREQAESTYRTVFDLTGDGLIILAPTGIILDLNRTTCEWLGYLKEDLLGRHVSDLYTRDCAVLIPERIDEVRRRGCTLFEASHLRRDGTVMPVEIHARLAHFGGHQRIISVARDIGERKVIEEAFALTQIAVDCSIDAVFWKDMEGCILKVNDRACRNLGYTREELVGMHVWDLDPHVTIADWPQSVDKLRRTGSVHVESHHRRKDGSVFPVEVIANYVRYRGTEHNISFVRDITDRRRAEAALRESEGRLRQAVRVAQTGIFDHDHHSNAIYWSPEQRAIYGVSADENVTLEDIVARTHPADRDMLRQAVRDAHNPAGDGLFDIQYRIVRHDGIRWVTTRSQTMFEGEGRARRPVRTVGALMDITDRMRAEEQVAYLAYYDSLTGLANRRLLHDRLERALAVSARNRLYGALLFIDLDHFKNINDTIGHDYGDLLLKEVANRLQSVLRESDTVSRRGGDEFVVILEEIGPDRDYAAAQAKAISDKILRVLAERCELHAGEYTGSASIGVVLFRGHEDTIDELLKRSDMAMYEAKKAGRGVARFFDPLMQAAFESRARVESDLRKALSCDQLVLFYQVRIGPNGQPAGAEALLRWVHPERGLVGPEEFIPVCEENGLILPVGEWVLKSACAQLRAWEAHPETRALKLSVNISANQFRQDDFVGRVARVIEGSGIDPTRLELELTESMFLENIEQSIEKMHALRDLGVVFALDDFGTGYSSLSYLKRLPLSQIKIDRSFVRDIAIDKNDEVIVQTIITMGRTLGLEVIAEGVETEEQRGMLELYGCRHFQGYLFGRPVPVREFERAIVDPDYATAGDA